MVAPLFDGDVVNVSAWRDEDKAGRHYRDYFSNARSYTLTNFRSDMRGHQGGANEIFLDLELPLPSRLRAAFDVVFNHTTLEHIYDFRRAFENLCEMSREAVIVVVPWLQPYHSTYGDYWRFSPVAIARMLVERGLTPAHIAWNRNAQASIYVFAIGVRTPARWRGAFAFDFDPRDRRLLTETVHTAGEHAFPAPLLASLKTAMRAALPRKRAPL